MDPGGALWQSLAVTVCQSDAKKGQGIAGLGPKSTSTAPTLERDVPMRAASLLYLLLLASPMMAQNRIDGLRPDAPELAAPGDLPVGVTTLTFVNPGQVDVVNATASEAPLYDRPLVVELWYPAATGTVAGGSYTSILRDGTTPVTLLGQAARDAAPAGGTYPLVILSHGYPGNRLLMGHLGENLASKGYVVASIDHTDSTYDNQLAFGSTLVNRPWDQRFVLDALADLDGPVGAMIDADHAAVIGYSMGGYGALIFAGAGVTADAPVLPWTAPGDLLARNVAGSETLAALQDDRVRAVIAIGPWGRNADLWDAAGLAGIEVPLLLVAGSVDDVSQYSAIRQIFAETTSTERLLLTFENANHNAGAPIPSPVEGYAFNDALGWAPFEHYADPVWDNVRMNNVLQHFATAFLDLHLKDDAAMGAFLSGTERASDGVWAVDEAGNPTEAFTYWKGFGNRTAVGLMLERLEAGD
jgi:predicted dienelactone hydrolase